jgi:hypothetical protein
MGGIPDAVGFFILGAMFGTTVAAFAMAMCIAASRSDEYADRLAREDDDKEMDRT